MDLARLVVVDFESFKLQPRPNYPPKPVGVAVQDAQGAEYWAWGHLAGGNNCTLDQACEMLEEIWRDPTIPICFHNAGFDQSVAFERLGLPKLPWWRVHDTTFLLFLYEPHSYHLDLKSNAEKYLGWPADEREELHEWIYSRRKQLIAEHGGNITKAKSGKGPAAWIAYAPGDLVGKYAIGDVRRTRALFEFLYPKIMAAGMGAAYDRERRLLPILMENERIGIRVDVEGLSRDIPIYQGALEDVEMKMRHYLRAPNLNFDNDRELAETFFDRGVVKEDAWVLTEKSGQLSVSKDNLLLKSFVDPLFAHAFGYRNRLVTCLKMFMLKWYDQAIVNRGYVHTQWNQVRVERGGTRSGRPSMTDPNLLNVSKSFEGRSDLYEHPAGLDLPQLPLVRFYMLPDNEHVWLHRDFSGQELRVFAHFESGELAAAYLANPDLDPHSWLKEAIFKAVGKELERTRVKNVTFARLFGGGTDAVMWQARCESRNEAKEIMGFHDKALPGRKILNDEIIRIVRRGDPIRTWGGRLYYVEPPGRVNGRRQTYEYKLINYLIQGSAADITKEAICRWHEGGGTQLGARFLLTVYDEINVSSPRENASEDMAYLREIMNGMELDVPMRSDGKMGERWGKLEKCE